MCCLPLISCLGQWGQIIICADSQRSNRRLQPSVARLDLRFVKVVKLQRLGKRKDVLLAVVADQRGLDRLHRRFAADIPESGKNFRITLAFNDGTDDPHARRTRDVGDDMMQLQVHLHQRLLHVLDVSGGILGEPFPLPHVGAQGGDLRLRAETAAEQAVGMQLAQPSRVAHIGFAAWHVLGVAGIHKNDLEATRFQDLEGWYPVNAGRFHSHAGDAA